MNNHNNIWVAAADGDLLRVHHLVLVDNLSPNIPDPNTYTPIHAAASYARIQVLDFLLKNGGNVNITDSDGDTPLYTVEDIPTAQFLIDHGATITHTNNDGISPIEHLSEDFPDVANYLQSRLTSNPAPLQPPPPPHPSQHSQHIASESLTTELLQSAAAIIQRADAQGRGPESLRPEDEDDLRRVVGHAVLQGMLQGYAMSTDDAGGIRGAAAGPNGGGTDDASPAKKPRPG